MKTLHLTILLLLAAGFAVGQPVIQVGNLNDPVPPAVPDLHFGQVAYAYLIYPPDQGACSQGGFKLETVHMYLEFAPDQVPVDFMVCAGLQTAVPDPSGETYAPGGPLCDGPLLQVHVDEPGPFVVSLPVGDACGCQPFDEHYFLTVRYPEPFLADLPIDDQPQAGVVYADEGAGWADMFLIDKTASGKVIIWGDLVCCEPVAAETRTWSGIKTLYR